MADHPEETLAAQPSHRAVIVRGAVLAGLCRFLPVPFLDDWLEERAKKHMIGSIFALHGREGGSEHALRLYGDPWSCLGTIWWVITFPVRLVLKLLKKIFKTVFFVLAIREVSLQIGRTLLLGHTTHRVLEQGGFPADSEPEAVRSEAEQVRTAFDTAFKGSDWRLIQHVLGGVFHGLWATVKLVISGVRSIRKAIPFGQEAPGLEGITHEVEDALASEEVAGYIEAFDRRFDEARGSASTDGA